MITFEEYCNNDLYAGLEELQNNPNYQCSISSGEITYTEYSICAERNEICMYDNQGHSYSMDLNNFVKSVQNKIYRISVENIKDI